MTDLNRKRLVVGISGASGVIYGLRALDLLRQLEIETHLVMTRSATLTLGHETELSLAEVHASADVVYQPDDVGAAIASGSFRTMGMLVAPARSAASRKSRPG
nr:flavoprotein [Marinicella sp. W31]MDC2875881.1 flavoprotein [Marinicella sp. W31]